MKTSTLILSYSFILLIGYEFGVNVVQDYYLRSVVMQPAMIVETESLNATATKAMPRHFSIMAENVLWSQNWKRYTMACPDIPLKYYISNTDQRYSAKEQNEWFTSSCEGGVLWIRSNTGKPSSVQTFAKSVVQNMKNPFILITADGDNAIPSSIRNFRSILDNPNCLRWYTQNYDGTFKHLKLQTIPIGFDLHTPWPGLWSSPSDYHDNLRHMLQLRRHSLPDDDNSNITNSRSTSIFIPPWNEIRHPDRKTAHEALHAPQCNTSNVHHSHGTSGPRVPITTTWEESTQYRFALSPMGKGIDCHRTWELLFFGVVPIVKTSSIDVLYEGLPVIIVQDYTDVCQKGFLDQAWEAIQQQGLWPARDEVFTMKYWLQKGVRRDETLSGNEKLLADIVYNLPF